MRVVCDHGIEDDQQFTDACCEDDFVFLALGLESMSKFADDRIAATGSQGRHVQRRADAGPSSLDAAQPPVVSAVTIHGGHADQSSDLLPVEVSQFGEFCQERGCGDIAHSGNALDDFESLLPVIVGFDKLEDGPVDPFELFVDHVDRLLQALLDGFGQRGEFAVGLGRALLDELPSTRDEFIELGLFFMGFGEGPRLDLQSEAGDDLGIQTVGFGANAQGLGKVADLPGIDDRDGLSRSDKFASESPFVATTGFHDDETSSWSRQLLDELCSSLRGIGESEGFLLGQEMDIEEILGNIDADKGSHTFHFERIPDLQMRARSAARRPAQAAVRADFKKPLTIQLRDGLVGPRHDRSGSGRPGRDCCATRWLDVSSLRNLAQDWLHLTS